MSRNHRISVMLLGSGYAAVHLADYRINEEDYDCLEWHTDVVQTGMGRYRTRIEAELEAKDWAEAEELPLVNQ